MFFIIILDQYESDGKIFTIYSKDGTNVSHIVETIVNEEETDVRYVKEMTFEQRILAETEYQTAILEMILLGGE